MDMQDPLNTSTVCCALAYSVVCLLSLCATDS